VKLIGMSHPPVTLSSDVQVERARGSERMQRVWIWYRGAATLTDPTGNVTPVEVEFGAEPPEHVPVRSFGGGTQTTPCLRTPFGR